MNKIATSILETVGYFFKIAGICSMASSILIYAGTSRFFISLVGSIVFFAIGYALIKWELRIESKRTEQVKHYDYVVLITLGVLCILGTLLNVTGSAGGYGNSAVRPDNIINQFGMSICFLAFGFNRKSMCSKESATAEQNVDISKNTPKD